jgi:hypothetical protein
MPSLISTTEKTVLTGIFGDIFDTFARDIVVYKEPIKTAIPVNPGNFVYGFGEEQGQDSFTYTEVTGVFPAVVRYGTQPQDVTQNADINAYIADGEVSIKVRKNCRDFINNGKTEKIVFDDRTFFLDSDEKKQTFLSSEFFIFKLKATK